MELIRKIRGRIGIGNIKPTKDDIWLVSYPKSGNTWIRLLLANSLFGNPDINNLIELQKYVPDIHFKNCGIKPLSIGSRRIIKSHYQYNSKYGKIIYVVRDPFNCAWSYYKFLKEWKNIEDTFEDFIVKFKKGDMPYGSWSDHVNSWVKNKSDDELLLIKYEQLLSETEDNLCKMIDYIGFNCNSKSIESSIKKASPEIVAKITNDRVFFGNKVPTFVNSPFRKDNDSKDKLRVKYEEFFEDMNMLYHNL